MLWRGSPLPDAELIRLWHGALTAAGHETGDGLTAGRRLLDRWREPHRHYHDLEHLSEVLIALEVLCAPPGVPQLAAFFHDAVYRARPGTDEQHSAALAAQMLEPLLPAAAVSAVTAAVLATRDHTASTLEEQLLNDADLAILAAPAVRYTRYCAGVREEYRAYPDPEFTAGRRAVLTDLLNRPRLFTTDAAHQLWERRARANLSAELAGHGLP